MKATARFDWNDPFAESDSHHAMKASTWERSAIDICEGCGKIRTVNVARICRLCAREA